MRLPVSSLAAALAGVVMASCDARLPEPESPGARLYKERCSSGCHRVYAPGLMKFPMWKVQVQRMEGELARKGLSLTADEERTLLDYLKRHSG